jgi:hypothetical protein
MHWIVGRKASAACFWLLAATFVFHVCVTAICGPGWPVAGAPNCVQALHSMPAPASAQDALEIIEPEVWRRTVRSKPDAQATAPIVPPAPSDPIVAREARASPARESHKDSPDRPRFFQSRAPPLPLAAA